MIRNVKQNLSLTALLFFMCCLFGCATTDFGWGNRFYSGRPLPNSEIALVFAVNDCSIYDIRDETEKEEKVFGFKLLGWGPWDMLDLLPGQYIAGVIYMRSSHGYTYGKGPDTGLTMGGRVQVELNVQAGNIYVIYPEMTRANEKSTWHPILVDINGYNKEECQRKYGGGLNSCYEKDKILELATKYLQSERRIMSYHPFKKPTYDGFTRRDSSGVWR